jgi:ketosteroid isomerase-like protein
VENRDRVVELLRLAGAMDVDALVECFADDAVIEVPFAPGRMPKQHRGRAAVREFLELAHDSFAPFTITVDSVYGTDDANVVVAEFHSDGIVRTNGRPYQNRYVVFFTFDHEGRLTNWREYYDAGVVVRAFRP